MRHQDRARLIAAAVAMAVLAWTAGPAPAEDPTATLRGGVLGAEADPPRMPKMENRDLRRARNYPEQPPTIPHTIRDYQIDLNANRCMDCHSRTAVERSQAPMVSVTHFMDRDGQVRAAVSPRRYFCLQCHVPQTEARPLIGNTFRDADSVLSTIKSREGG